MDDLAARTAGRVAANGIELAYETFGDAGAPPAVLIMGLATQMIAWPDEMCESLAWCLPRHRCSKSLKQVKPSPRHWARSFSPLARAPSDRDRNIGLNRNSQITLKAPASGVRLISLRSQRGHRENDVTGRSSGLFHATMALRAVTSQAKIRIEKPVHFGRTIITTSEACYTALP
jgi:hypothetical protein